MTKTIILVCSLVLITSCKSKENKKDNIVGTESKSIEFDYGDTQNGVYTNDFFGIKIQIPDTWVIQNKDQVNELNDRGAELIAKDDENLKAQLKASEIKTAYLLTLFRDSVGSTREFNPSFFALAENISQFPQVKEGKDYLESVKTLLGNSSIGYTFDQTYGSRKIGKYNFDILESTAIMNGTEVTQHYYATITEGFALCFITTFADDGQKKQVDKIISDISIQ